MNHVTIGEIIKHYRKKNNLTQENLSFGICSIPYLSKLENNQIQASEEILLHLCTKLNLKPKELNNLTSPKILEELFRWNTLITKGDLEEAIIIKKSLDKKQEYFNDHFLRIYHDLFSIHLLLKRKESVSLKDITEISTLYNYMDIKQRYYLRKIQGIYYFQESNWNKSALYFEKAVSHAQVAGIQEADLFYNLSIIYSRLRKFLYSNKYIKICEDLYQQDFNYKKIINCKMIFAINNLLMKEYQLAKEDFENLLTNNELENSLKAKILHNIGIIYFKQRNYSKAETTIRESLKIKSDFHSLLKSYYFLSIIYFELDCFEEGNKYYELGKSLVTNLKNQEYLYKFQILEYKFFNKFEEIKWEQILKKEIVPFFKSYGDKDDYIEALKLLGEHYYTHKKYKQAADIFIEINEVISDEGGEIYAK